MVKLLLTILTWLFTVTIGLFLQQDYVLEKEQDDNSLLANVLGDSRRFLSFKMIEIADEYYHGGVQHKECTHGIGHHQNGHDHDHQKTLSSGHEPQQHEKHSSRHRDGVSEKHPRKHQWTSWSGFINAKIHPSGHKHLKGKRYEKEIVPWVWAAVEANPHNISAYQVAAYWLANRLGKPEQALKIIAKGIKENPESCELELGRARVLFRHKANYERALIHLRKALAKWNNATSVQSEALSKSDKIMYERIIFYLVDCNMRLNRSEAAKKYVQEALPIIRHKKELRQKLQRLPEK